MDDIYKVWDEFENCVNEMSISGCDLIDIGNIMNIPQKI